MKKAVLITAAGMGKRLWPLSNAKTPKPFVCFTDDGETLIRKSEKYAQAICVEDDIYVYCRKSHKNLVKKQLPGLNEKNILCCPDTDDAEFISVETSKNTVFNQLTNIVAGILLTAEVITDKSEDAILIVIPCDMVIENEAGFKAFTEAACELAASGDNIIISGKEYDASASEIGRFKVYESLKYGEAYKVKIYSDKTEEDKSEKQFRGARNVLDCGIRVVSCSTLKNLLKNQSVCPDSLICAAKCLRDEKRSKEHTASFLRFEENAAFIVSRLQYLNTYVLVRDFGWKDTGSWSSIAKLKKKDEYGNSFGKNVVAIESKNCMVESGKINVVLRGVKDLIVVETDDALLITTK